MKIENTKLENAVVMKVSGRMDTENSEIFSNACAALIAEGAVHVIADLNDLQYVSSSGLGCFLSAAKELQARSGSLALCGLHGLPLRVFEMTNLLSLFPVFETTGEALAAI
jgi:anti-sigma B factor antagonist